LSHTTGAVSLVKLGQPLAVELGYADSISVDEIDGKWVTVVKNEESGNLVSTVVIWGSTDSVLDDIERAVDDGVNSYKAMCQESRILPGAGATKMELARRLRDYGAKETGLEQYAMEKFAESLEVVPWILAENGGLNSTDMISSLYAAHAAGSLKAGVDIEQGGITDMTAADVWDLLTTKYWAIKLATGAACTVLWVDQIIIAKQPGGPKGRPADGGDED
jgi:T-complex protein 1 subunit theta